MRPRTNRLESFKVKFFVAENGCWLWQASLTTKGYGSFWDGSRLDRAHRYSYKTFRGEIPKGLIVMHKCDIPACVNPVHLQLGTYQDNVDDAISKKRFKSNANWGTEGALCKKGHDVSSKELFVGVTVKVRKKAYKGFVCKTCKKEYAEKFKKKERDIEWQRKQS